VGREVTVEGKAEVMDEEGEEEAEDMTEVMVTGITTEETTEVVGLHRSRRVRKLTSL